MMRLVFKALVVVCLAIGIGNYIIYLKTGRLPASEWKEKLSLEGFSLSPTEMLEDTKKATHDALDEHFSGDDKASFTKIYKWTDDNGVVHYGEKPAGTGAQELNVENTRLTIMPATESAGSPAASTPSINENPAAAIESAETPIEKARAAAEAMKAHHDRQSQY